MTARTDPHVDARLALACLDLTSLNDGDTEADIAHLCRRAQGPCGPVAAVCVWPRFAASARALLPGGIAVAAVVNFPAGGTNLARVLRETGQVVQAGAQEVDLVLPYTALMDGDAAGAMRVVQSVRAACAGLKLKLILETGVLGSDGLIAQAARIGLDAGADFIKTSTDRTAISATAAAARVILQAIASHPGAASRAGFNASGGVRTVTQAATYIALVQEILGAEALVPARFRIGASSLLDDIEAVLGGTSKAATATTDRY